MVTERESLLEWIAVERDTYAIPAKYGPGLAGQQIVRDAVALGGFVDEGLMDFVGNYLKRAQLFGLDTPQGRQATGKAIVSLLNILEVACELFGPMPLPGFPSGEIHPSEGAR